MIKRMTLALLAGCMLVTTAWAQAPLDGPLTIVVGYPPGGSSDRMARLVADRLKDRLGTTVIVENKTGAGGRISAQQVRHADATQNVLLLGNPAVMVVAPLVYADPGYDAKRDFQPVSLVSSYKFALAVSADSPMKDMTALQAWLKKNPDRFTVGVPATGSLPHFFALMLGNEIGQPAEVIGYRGSAPLLSELVGGIVPQAIDTLDTVLPQHQGGRVRILATSGTEREPGLAGVPTFREAGVDLVADGWNAFFAPAGMPQEKVERLASDIAAVMREPAMQAAVRAANLVPVSADASQTRAALAAYREQWEPVVRDSGFQATP